MKIALNGVKLEEMKDIQETNEVVSYDSGPDPNKVGHKFKKEYKQKVKDFHVTCGENLEVTLSWVRESYPSVLEDVVRSWVDDEFRVQLNEQRNILNKRWRKNNPEKYAEVREKNDQQHFMRRTTTHKEHYYAETRRWRSENTEHLQEYGKRKWREGKSEALKRKRERMKTDPEFKLLENARCYIWQQLQDAFNVKGPFKKPERTSDLLGCTPTEYLSHLRSLYKPGMTDENYGEWHVDHIRPCASFNLLDETERRKCFHYTNTQPLWANENQSKGDKWERND